MEIWTPVVGFKDYEISSFGRLRSITTRKGARARINNGIVNGWIQRITHSYARRLYALRKDGKTYVKKAHQLVLEAFVGPCPQGYETRHVNGNSLDNCVTNLQYGTHKDNIHDSIKHGTHSKPPIIYAHLSLEQRQAIRKAQAYYGVNADLARKYHVAATTIKRIRIGRASIDR